MTTGSLWIVAISTVTLTSLKRNASSSLNPCGLVTRKPRSAPLPDVGDSSTSSSVTVVWVRSEPICSIAVRMMLSSDA
jgi:hypothetical protein